MADGNAPRPPRAPTPPAGPGRFSRRTDQSQPVAVPSHLAYGLRSQLENAQAQVPLPQRRGAAAAPGSQPSGTLHGGPPPLPPVTGRLESLLARPSTQPGEPLTSGLPIGAGPGPVETAATPAPFESDRIRQLAMASTDPDMPIQVRAFGALVRLIEDARSAQINILPVMTVRDFLDEGEEDPSVPTLVEGTLGDNLPALTQEPLIGP